MNVLGLISQLIGIETLRLTKFNWYLTLGMLFPSENILFSHQSILLQIHIFKFCVKITYFGVEISLLLTFIKMITFLFKLGLHTQLVLNVYTNCMFGP